MLKLFLPFVKSLHGPGGEVLTFCVPFLCGEAFCFTAGYLTVSQLLALWYSHYRVLGIYFLADSCRHRFHRELFNTDMYVKEHPQIC